MKPQTRLRQFREARGLAMADLARLAEVNYFNLSRYECGVLRPGRQTLAKLTRAQDATPEELGFPRQGE